MRKLFHHGVSESKAAKVTRDMRRSDVRVCYEITTTQVWSWKGGDAIVLVTHKGVSMVVLRTGKTVRIFNNASVSSAMDAAGLDSKEYKVVPGSEKAKAVVTKQALL